MKEVELIIAKDQSLAELASDMGGLLMGSPTPKLFPSVPSGEGFGVLGWAIGCRMGSAIDGLSMLMVGQGVTGTGAMDGAMDMDGCGVPVVGLVGAGEVGEGVGSGVVGEGVGSAVIGMVRVGAAVGADRSRQLDASDTSSRHGHRILTSKLVSQKHGYSTASIHRVNSEVPNDWPFKNVCEIPSTSITHTSFGSTGAVVPMDGAGVVGAAVVGAAVTGARVVGAGVVGAGVTGAAV
ncbi:MAG: hypothetical protein SGBAC_008593 [Bacillariaceae sp.]